MTGEGTARGVVAGAQGARSVAEQSGDGRRRGRRVSTPPPAGSDPQPHDPPLLERAANENDARLREDRPPHWG